MTLPSSTQPRKINQRAWQRLFIIWNGFVWSKLVDNSLPGLISKSSVIPERRNSLTNFIQFQSFQAFITSGFHLDIGCYPEAPLLLVGRSAPPEGLSIPPLLNLRYYAFHVTNLSTKTMERHCQRHDYVNHEFDWLLRMLMVEYAGALIVGTVLESQYSKRVPVL